MPRWPVFFCIGLLFCARPGHAQVYDAEVSSHADPAAAVDEQMLEGVDTDALADQLFDLAAAPLDLNTSGPDDLARIPFLTPSLTRLIVQYRTRSGTFRSVEDLLRVRGMTPELLEAIRPYVRAGGRAESRTDDVRSRRKNAVRLQALQRVSYRTPTDNPARYLGAPVRMLTRLRAQRERIGLNVTLERDAGEAFRWHPATGTYGYDFASASFAVRGAGHLETLVVGDFALSFGQGLVFWNGGSFGKGIDAVQAAVRTGRGITAYGSTDETRFFRGVAASVRLGSLRAALFASRRSLDAALTDSSALPAETDAMVTALPESGLHRTPQELARKGTLSYGLLGGQVEVRHRGLTAGLVGYTSRFGLPMAPQADPYRRYQHGGSHAAAGSLYASLTSTSAHLFGEAAIGMDGVVAGVGGVVLEATPQATLVLHARHLPERFVSLHGDAFGEYSGPPQNESGVFAGLTLKPAPAWQLAAYFDVYESPWLRFRTPRPSRGHETAASVSFAPRAWMRVTLSGRSETKEEGVRAHAANTGLLDAVAARTRQTIRLDGKYAFSDRLQLQARIEAVRSMSPVASTEHGLLIYQDVRWQITPQLRISTRLAIFETDGFESRIHAYEPDLRFAFSVPSHQGRGQHGFVLVQFAPVRSLLLQIKRSVTRYDPAATTSTGLPEAPRRGWSGQIIYSL